MTRTISIAAGVTPELAADPTAFVTTAAEAGWRATGVWFDPASWTAATTRSVASAVRAADLDVVDMEVVRIGSDADVGEPLLDAAAEIGARNILCISSLDEPAATAARLHELCELAAPAQIRVCIEFMKFTTIKTLADAVEMVRLVDHPNAGILVDQIHLSRSGGTIADIAGVDPALLPYAQWCDAPAAPASDDTRGLITDALDDRSIPGEGDLPVAEFVHAFDESVPFSVEVRSRALREAFTDPTDRAAHLLAGTQAALHAAG